MATHGEGIDVEAMYRRYGPMVLRRCRALLKDEEQAMDALQETFERVLRHRRRLTGDAPSSLLYRTATHVCLNRLRSAARHPEAPGDDLLSRIAAADEPEARSLARGVLGALFSAEPASTRVIATLHLHDGLTLEEVAAEVGLSVSGVRGRLRRLRARLVDLEGAPA